MLSDSARFRVGLSPGWVGSVTSGCRSATQFNFRGDTAGGRAGGPGGRVKKPKQTSNEHGRQRRNYQRRESGASGGGEGGREGSECRSTFLLGPVSPPHPFLEGACLEEHFLFHLPCQFSYFSFQISYSKSVSFFIQH